MSLIGCVVVGAGGSIGRAIFEELIQSPEFDVIVALSQDAGNGEMEHRENVVRLGIDYKNPAQSMVQLKSVLREKDIELRGVALVAGQIEARSVLMSSIDVAESMLKSNFYVHVQALNSLLPLMLKSGGAIVAVSSSAAVLSSEGRAAYAASKAALSTYCLVAGRELGRAGIRVNIVSPGLTDTKLMKESTSSEGMSDYLSASAFGAIADPSDVAHVVTFLLGSNSKFVTCQNVSVDGGARL